MTDCQTIDIKNEVFADCEFEYPAEELLDENLSDFDNITGQSWSDLQRPYTGTVAEVQPKKNPTPTENLLLPSSPDNLKNSLENSLNTLYESIEAVDMLISEYAMELNRGQKLFTPRLCVAFFKTWAIRFGDEIRHDRKPVFAWQQSSRKGDWFLRRLSNPQKFNGRDYLRRMPSGRKNAGDNDTALSSVIVQIKKLMERRRELEQTAIAIRKLAQSEGKKNEKLLSESRNRLYVLRGRIETRLPERVASKAKDKGFL